ncbi:MAG: hypothetical protein M1840_003832 [Geoglossum simile]|nr:MAG: hypothetical protein M1840_003832 [Geoglossum simile]
MAGRCIDIIAVSCDSFREETNIKIGRGKGSHLQNVIQLSQLCRKYGIKFKLNTVVNRLNFEEDMNECIQEIQPFRWKCFQVLIIEGENDSDSTLHDASRFIITDEEFAMFCKAHSGNNCFVAEPNNIMKSSYLILDEYMRFLNKGTGSPTPSILEVGVKEALKHVYWDKKSFYDRGGIYEWSKIAGDHSQIAGELDWVDAVAKVHQERVAYFETDRWVIESIIAKVVDVLKLNEGFRIINCVQFANRLKLTRMTDMSGTSNVSGTSRSSTRSKLSPVFKELFGAARKLVGHEKEIDNLDQILDDKKELERNLKLKEGEITKLRSTKDSEIASHRLERDRNAPTQFKTWDIGTTKQEELKREIDGLSVELSEANGSANSFEKKNALLQRQLGERQDAVVEVENKLKTVRGLLNSKERELTGTVKALEDCQNMLDEERRELGLEYPDHEDFSDHQIQPFAERCHDLAGRFFLTQLPEDSSLDHLWMKLLQSGFNKAASRNIPISDSMQSKYLRKAVAEKIIANKLCINIFQQYYLPESPATREAMDDVLERLYTDNPRGEAIFRRRLLSAYKPEEEEYQVAKVMESTQAEVVGLLDPLLFGLNARESFRSELENDPEPDWSEYKEYDTAVGLTAEQSLNIPAQSDAIMSLFPQVSMDDKVICPGYALWSSQNTVVAANIEYSQSNLRNSAYGRTGSIRGGTIRRGSDRRKPSLSGSSTVGGRMGDIPTPLGSPSGNQSFSEHAHSRSMTIPGLVPKDDEKAPGEILEEDSQLL